MYRAYSAVGDGDADSEGSTDADAEAEADADAEADGWRDPDGAGTEGTGTGVGSGMKREGTPSTERTRISTNAAMTSRIHGRASRSSRGGSAPR
jgi:hypothetical protein